MWPSTEKQTLTTFRFRKSFASRFKLRPARVNDLLSRLKFRPTRANNLLSRLKNGPTRANDLFSRLKKWTHSCERLANSFQKLTHSCERLAQSFEKRLTRSKVWLNCMEKIDLLTGFTFFLLKTAINFAFELTRVISLQLSDLVCGAPEILYL